MAATAAAMTSLMLLVVLLPGRPVAHPADSRTADSSTRAGRSLAYFGDPYLDTPPMLFDQIEPDFLDDYYRTDAVENNEILSRARPARPRPQSGYVNSPIYYIRLPPTPYVFVPGVGYVSQPPSLSPPTTALQSTPPDSQFLNLPINFVSNGKPTGVYTWTPPPRQPKPPPPDTPMTSLNKGPYLFNGRPSDIFVLRNTYNSLYSDSLQNYYP